MPPGPSIEAARSTGGKRRKRRKRAKCLGRGLLPSAAALVAAAAASLLRNRPAPLGELRARFHPRDDRVGDAAAARRDRRGGGGGGRLDGMDEMEELRRRRQRRNRGGGRWHEPRMDTESFSCETTVGGLHRLQTKLGLRGAVRGNVSASASNRSSVLASLADGAVSTFGPSSGRNYSSDAEEKDDGDDDDDPEILLTDFGWMNAARAESEPRSKWGALMQAAIQDHPWYNPAGWAKVVSRRRRKSAAPLRRRTRYVFLDVETCGEPNWPIYAGCQGEGNFEGCNGKRPSGEFCWGAGNPGNGAQERICSLIKNVLNSAVFAEEGTDSKVVVFNCMGYGPGPAKEQPFFSCLGPGRPGGDKVVVVALSARHTQMLPGTDMGLPPPAVKPSSLGPEEAEAIRTCAADAAGPNGTRPYLLSFMASLWPRTPARAAVARLREGREGDVLTLRTGDPPPEPGATYESLLSRSKFSAAVRGDNLFSFRFAELLSAGAVPVVYADGWVLPFSRDLVPWESYMVVIEERKANETLRVLDGISAERRCRMRRRGWEVYNRYMRTRAGTLQGILDGLEARRLRKRRSTSELRDGKRVEDWSVMTPFHENGTLYCVGDNIDRLGSWCS